MNKTEILLLRISADLKQKIFNHATQAETSASDFVRTTVKNKLRRAGGLKRTASQKQTV